MFGRPSHVKTLSFPFPRSVLVIVWHFRPWMFMYSHLLQNQLPYGDIMKERRTAPWHEGSELGNQAGTKMCIFIITYNVLLSSLLPELLVIEWVINVASVRDLSPENTIPHMKGNNFRKLMLSNNPGLLSKRIWGTEQMLFYFCSVYTWWRHLSLYLIFFRQNLYFI